MSLKNAEIKSTPEHGRGVHTTVAIPPGTNVIEESPYAHGIIYTCKGIICDHCSYMFIPPKGKTDEEKEKLKANPPQMKRCSKCKLQYYCSAVCQKKAWGAMHKFECKYLCEQKDIPTNHHWMLLWRVCLKLWKSESREADKGIIDLEPNYKAFDKVRIECEGTSDWIKGNKPMEQIIAELTHRYNFSDPGETLFEICARLINNRMAIGPDEECNGSTIGVGIYPIGSMCNHSCRPNTLWQTFKNNKLIVRSQEPMKQGQECFISYVDTTKLSTLRKKHIVETYHFECDCYGCSSKDLDADQSAGGDYHELVALGDVKGLEKLPVHNMEIMGNLQQSFDDAVRIDKSAEKAYKFGERLMMGMLYYQNKCHRRPDFNRAIAVHYLFMAELGLALKKDARIIQLYILKCTAILDVTDGPESPLTPRIKKLKAMLMVVAGHLRKEQEHNDKMMNK